MFGRSQMVRLLAGGVLAGGLLLPATAVSTDASRAPEPSSAAPAAVHNGRIAFSTGFILTNPDLSGHSQVFTVNPDGSDIQRLTNVPAGSQAGAPDISPDGGTIAFVSNVSGNFEVWTMNADGTDQQPLVSTPGFDYFGPRWSPDGTHLAVTRCDVTHGFTTECDLDMVNANGTGLRRVVGGHRFHGNAAFSPDGSRIAFDSDRGGLVSAIWVVPVDGGRPTRLTKPNREAFWPSWSPDGRRILFSNNCCRPRSNVFVMRADGSHVRALTHVSLGHNAAFASYSPNGRRIVFMSDLRRSPNGPNNDLFTMRADGTHVRRIVSNHPHLALADWGPAPSAAAKGR